MGVAIGCGAAWIPFPALRAAGDDGRGWGGAAGNLRGQGGVVL